MNHAVPTCAGVQWLETLSERQGRATYHQASDEDENKDHGENENAGFFPIH